MTQFWKKTYSINFGGEPSTQLSIAFDVTRTSTREPNIANISILNLSQSTRSKIVKDVPVALSAGWGDDISEIFKGTVRKVKHTKQGTEWVTAIEASDGEEALRKSAQFSLGKNASLENVAKKLIETMGIEAGNLVQKIRQKGAAAAVSDFAGGFVLDGKPSDALDTITKSLGLNFSVQSGKGQAVENEETFGTQATKLSPQTGLLGSPEIGEEKRVILKSLLNPTIAPGGLIVLESEGLSGNFKALKVSHVGAYRGAEWHTNIEAKAI